MAEYRKEKYFWLKLKRDFFKRHDIRVVEDMPNGKEYILFYLKLLVESIDHEGELMFSETIPYNAEMLASVTNTNVDIVKAALRVFYDLDMIECLDSGALYMREVEHLIGSQSISAEKKEIQRKKIEGGQRVDNCPPELEIDIELDKEKELEKEIEKDTLTQINDFLKNKPSIGEIQQYILETGRKVNVNEFWDKTCGCSIYKGEVIYDWKGLIDRWAETEIAVPIG